MSTVDLRRLADFFPAEDLDWKPIAVSKKTGKALAAAYLTNRAIMDRFDAVCGPENWRNEFVPGPSGGVLCGLSVRVTRGDGTSDWVTKWDGAENTDIEGVKGGLSGSMRRAAVQFGVGRYLYDFPQQWVPVDDYGKFSQQPRVPREYLPAAPNRPERAAAPDRPAERRSEGGERMSERPAERAGGRPGFEGYERQTGEARARDARR